MTALLFHSLCKCDICIQNVHDGFLDKRLLPDLGREYMLRYRYTVYIQQGSVQYSDIMSDFVIAQCSTIAQAGTVCDNIDHVGRLD